MTTNTIEKLMSEILESISNTDELVKNLYKGRDVARFYKDMEFLEWIDSELTGYKEGSTLPEYRENIPAHLYEEGIIVDRFAGIGKKIENIIAVQKIPLGVEVQTIISGQTETLYMKLPVKLDNGKWITGNLKFDSGIMRSIINSIKLKISDYIHEKNFSITNDRETILMNIFNRFHISALSLKNRHAQRIPFEISDEYDVQDILKPFLKIHFKVLVKEEITKKFGNKNPRIDFLLIDENIGIEVKYVKKNNKSIIIDQILADKELYSVDDRILELYFFIYDPDYLIDNRNKFIKDLEEFKNPAINKIKIIIKPYEE